ncbi:MAG: DNRLRE domain-containing protein, partial [Bacillota bacterium]
MKPALVNIAARRNNRHTQTSKLLRDACRRVLSNRPLVRLEGLESRTLLSTVELNPIADTYVRDANPDINYGSEATLVVKNDRSSTAYDGNDRQTYLKFDLSGITGPITSATLVLTGQSDVNGDGYFADVYGVPSTNWQEDLLTWNTRPARDITLQDSAFVVTNVDQVYQWNVTNWITSHTGGQVAFTLTETYLVDDNGRMHFYSRENTDKKPKLIISTGTPQAPAAAANVTATPQGGDKIRLSWSGVAQASTYQILRSTTSGSGYTLVGTSATQSFVDTGLNAATDYYYIVKAVNGTAVGAASAEATAKTFTTPAGWTGTDIGSALNPGGKGSASYDAETQTFAIQGGGSDIWNNGDSFYYFYQPFNTEGTITAQVISQDVTGGWAKSGVMVRESLGLASKHAFVATTPSNGIAMQTRPVDDVYGNCTSVNVGTGQFYAPYWVRLTRTGNVFTGEMSPDGVTWSPLGTQHIAMGTNVYVGLAVGAVTGTVSTTLNNSSFDNVTITPLQGLSTPALQALSFEGSAINLSFLENPFASKFVIERSTTADFSANVTTFEVDPNGTSFTDVSADPTQTNYYRMKAVGAAGQSAYSAVVGANIAAQTFIGDGVRAEYFNNHFRRGETALTRFEIDLYEPFGDGNGSAGPSVDADHFSSRWTGRIIAPATGTYTIISLTDDDGYLWVDGQLVSSDPGGHGYRDATNITPIDLEEGQSYDFVFEQLDSGGGAYARVDWIRPDGVRETIPTQYLRPDMGALKPMEGITKAAPSDLSIMNDGTSGYVGLSWTDNARNETGFLIERATNSSFTDAVIVDRRPASTEPYSVTVYGYDTPIQPNTKYYYRVKAINPDNSSSYS